MMDEGACPVCEAHEWRSWLTASDMYTGQPFALVRCAACGVGRTLSDEATAAARDSAVSPADTGAPGPGGQGGRERSSEERLYAVAGQADAGARFGGPLEQVMRALRRGRVAAIEGLHPGPGRILDVGCGRGVLLAELQARGWDVHGTELSAAIATTARAALGLRVRIGDLQALDFGDLRFDVLSFFHVLEHLEDPAGALARAGRLLAPGGRVVVGVPNADSWQARAFGGQWLHLDVPRHRWHFSTATLERLAGRCGLQVVATRQFSFEYGPYGVLQGLLSRAGLGRYLFARLLRRAPPAELLREPRFWAHLALAGPITAAAAAALPLELVAAAAGAGGAITLVLAAREP